jgi:hypothetical protein
MKIEFIILNHLHHNKLKEGKIYTKKSYRSYNSKIEYSHHSYQE